MRQYYIFPLLWILLFQSTHSRGVRQGQTAFTFTPMDFNPRTHEECDYKSDINNMIEEQFQSTHSRGVRRCPYQFALGRYQFQSTHSRGVRQPAPKPAPFQSTHSRGVRQKWQILLEKLKEISIHALTRSATMKILKRLQEKLFQSTHSRGVRHSAASTLYLLCTISIHALTRSATILELNTLYQELFQSTHSRGVRQPYLKRISPDLIFQSTHSRGVRPFTTWKLFTPM